MDATEITVPFLNTRQALVGRIRQQNLCTLVYRRTLVHKTYMSYVLFAQHKGYSYLCTETCYVPQQGCMKPSHKQCLYNTNIFIFTLMTYHTEQNQNKRCFAIMVHKILHRPVAIAMNRNIILFYSYLLAYLYKRKCTKT
jgi:hypothetical protein